MDIRFKNFIKIFFFVALSLLFSGCVGLNKTNIGNTTHSGAGINSMTRKTTGVYYDFDDILVPKELKVIDNKTVIVTTPGYISGIITLKGAVEKRSLSMFFLNNMQKDNWESVSQIRSPASTIMIFKKPTKWAVITIRENDFSTYVEIGVSPTLAKDVPSSSSSSEKNIFN